ncbi:hypothetical protein R83H12_02996 [Fibrobacteria bacterium R8-3-H12]
MIETTETVNASINRFSCFYHSAASWCLDGLLWQVLITSD